ncbi:MAG: hypothetical protein QOE66_283 [Chloroflexota bacterium]|nr:hypothetical protein [Chloroflexota bacterium]
MTRRHGRAILVILPTLLVFGCVSGDTQAGNSTGPVLTAPVSQPPPPSQAGIPAGTVLETAQPLGDPHITMVPPGSPAPAISSDAAYELCLSGVADCLPEPPTAIKLARVTDTAYGTTSSPGVDTLTLNNTLVWAITWIGSSHCVFAGGGPGAQPSEPQVQPLCDRVVFVDATTGKFVYTVSYAHQ